MGSSQPWHISIEPLLNESTAALVGTTRNLVFTPVNEVGVGTSRATISATSTAQEITINTGMRTIEIFNGGDSWVYYGGSGVTSLTGIPIFPNMTKTFANVRDDFSIYLVTAVGETATVRILEFT